MSLLGDGHLPRTLRKQGDDEGLAAGDAGLVLKDPRRPGQGRVGQAGIGGGGEKTSALGCCQGTCGKYRYLLGGLNCGARDCTFQLSAGGAMQRDAACMQHSLGPVYSAGACARASCSGRPGPFSRSS